jgi:hypothetical protein
MIHATVDKAIAEMRRGVVMLKYTVLFPGEKVFCCDDTMALAAELRVNTTLTELDLGNSIRMSLGGAASLAEALVANRALTVLDLCSNDIDDACALSLRSA